MASSSLIFNLYAPQQAELLPQRGRHRLRAWLPVAAFSLHFAVESTSYFGADHTSAPLRRMAEALFGYDACVHWNAMHHLIRKTGHFVGYGAFSLVCFRAFWMTLCGVARGMQRRLRACALALLLTFLVASADEFHQSFLPNRWGSFSDVLLDTCGGVALCMALFLAMQLVEWSRKVALTSRPDVARTSSSALLQPQRPNHAL